MNLHTYAYQLLELIAISGELPTDLGRRLMGESYFKKLITKLKDRNLIKVHYKDKLRGYRLTQCGKKQLLEMNPERFNYYLTGLSETNRIRSEVTRRRRLHHSASLYYMLLQSGVTLFRDGKPAIFHPNKKITATTLSYPLFYHSREIKELGLETTKINNSRMHGVLLTEDSIFVLYYTNNSLMKWEYRTEFRVRALLKHHVTQGVLSSYPVDTSIRALIIGDDMNVSESLLPNARRKKGYFHFDQSYDYYHYVPNTEVGILLLRLLTSPEKRKQLNQLLLSDLLPITGSESLDCDAKEVDGIPVLFAWEYDLLRISRFVADLRMRNIKGHIICFDFQKEVLEQFCGEQVEITSVDTLKFKRRFFDEE